jgi:hypothetical protein
MGGNVSIVKAASASIGVTPEEKAMLLKGSGFNDAQARCYVGYGEYAKSDANVPPVDGEHVAMGTVLPERNQVRGPYDPPVFSRINTTPKTLEG